MTTIRFAVPVLALAALLTPAAAGHARAPQATALAAPAASPWGRTFELAGPFLPGGSAFVSSVSCASVGNCVAGGAYSRPRSGPTYHGFVVTERNGVWRRAFEVPGLRALHPGGSAQVTSVSCASVGNCAAGGYYHDRSGQQGFVVSERHGVWGRALGVPGLGALNVGGFAQVTSVSCASAGNCAAGGYNLRGHFSRFHGFVVSQRNGRWGRAIEVPDLRALPGRSVVSSVSCGSAGNCAAGGYYTDRSGRQGFVVSEKNGRWGRALRIRGMGGVDSVSCASAGNCSAGGWSLVVSEKNGRWGRAIEVPGLGVLNVVGATLVSCASAGNCAAGGFSNGQGFVVSQRNGVWGRAIKVPGLALNAFGFAEVTSVSCAPAGNCAAGGEYIDRSSHGQGFVVSERHGVWGRAIEVPGLDALERVRVR